MKEDDRITKDGTTAGSNMQPIELRSAKIEASHLLGAVLSNIDEVERNKRLFLLLQKLIENKEYELIGLLRTMVEKDTPAMQKSYQIMTILNSSDIPEDIVDIIDNIIDEFDYKERAGYIEFGAKCYSLALSKIEEQEKFIDPIPEEIRSRINLFNNIDKVASPYSPVEYGYRLALPEMKELKKKVEEQASQIQRLEEKAPF